MNPSHWTIPRRLVYCLGGLFLILVLMGLQGFWQADAVRREIGVLADDSLPSVTLLSHLDSLHQGSLTHLIEFVETRTPGRRAELERKLASVNAAFTEAMARAETLPAADEERRLFNEFKRARADFLAAFNRMLELSRGDNPPPAGELAEAAALFPKSAAAQQALQRLIQFNEGLGLAAGRSGKAHALTGIRRIGYTLAAALALTVLVGWMAVRSIHGALHQLSASLEQGVRQTASAAREVASASQALAAGASEQAASVEETSASLELMAGLIQGTAGNAQRAKALASGARASAELGSRRRSEVGEVMAAMDASNAQVAKIVRDIDEIAFQTNILALNAAVEAARAGEAGAGFAVVADEVRSLAQRSAAAAKETAGKVELVLSSSRKVSQLSHSVGECLGQIAEQVAATDALVSAIAVAASEQAQGIGQINQAIGQIDQAAQGTASRAEETAAMARQMEDQAASLHEQGARLRQLAGSRSEPTTPGRSRRVRVAAAPAAPGRFRQPAKPPEILEKPRAIPMPGDPPPAEPRPF
ncbi:MAG: hypothetical protein RJA22_3040 [Verrucomicrobiota bacterium]|jgi:methyl-accepting chemotaxis protein